MTVSAPFAAIEASLAADTLRMLANAVATVVATGAEFAIIFDNGTAAVLAGMASAAVPSAQALDTDLTSSVIAVDSQVTIRAVDYKVRDLQPDGAGLTTMILELA